VRVLPVVSPESGRCRAHFGERRSRVRPPIRKNAHRNLPSWRERVVDQHNLKSGRYFPIVRASCTKVFALASVCKPSLDTPW